MKIRDKNRFFNYRLMFLLLLIGWTSITIFQTWFEISELKEHILFTAEKTAEAFTKKDIALRQWAAHHGGVYVPVTPETPPNPYLSFIKRRDLKAHDKEGNEYDLTLMNPAYLTREFYENFGNKAVFGRITSLTPLRPENSPSKWERHALEKIHNGAKKVTEIVKEDGKYSYNYMIPFYATEACLKCHASQGYKVGDIRGGIHITFSLDDILADYIHHRNHIFTLQFIVWLGGLVVLLIAYKAMQTACTSVKEREEFLRSIINAIPDPVCYKDSNGRWIECNIRSLEILGLEGMDYRGKSNQELAEMVHPALRDAILTSARHDRETLREGKITRRDESIKLPDGSTRLFDVIRVPLAEPSVSKKSSHRKSSAKAAHPKAILIVSRDITERKHLEAQLQQSQKMEAIGILAGGVAHDLNNILQTIVGATGLAIMKIEPNQPALKYLNQIDTSCQRATAIIRQLLIFSRRQDLNVEPLNLNDVTKELLKMLRRLIGENISVKTSFEPDLDLVLADRNKIEQVIMNLVINARDAMPSGGEIFIATENRRTTPEDLEHYSHLKEGNYVCIIVQDTGSGIPKDILEKIFDPFFTTKGVGKGTGLGLSTVYGIISRLKGWIHVESEPGKGTTFRICIPAADPEDIEKEKQKAKKDSSSSRLRGNGERILVVEDDEDIRRVVTDMLNAQNYSATAVASGEDALRLIEDYEEKFDVMLVDMVLPGINGLDLVKMISYRKKLPGVILNSGYTDERADISKLQAEDDYVKFITKPYEFNALLRLIRKVIEEQK